MVNKILRDLYFCRKYRKSITILLAISVIFATSAILLAPVSAVEYSITLTTSGPVDIATQAGVSSIDSSELNVVTNCRAGYNLTLSTTISNNNLYLNGNSENNTENTFFTPSNGTTTLASSPNTWGYSLSVPSSSDPSTYVAPTANNIFHPVPSSTATPAILKSTDDTSSETDINDTFNVYYGANADTGLSSGSYRMINDTSEPATPGALSYYLTASPSCVSNIDVTYNYGDQTFNGAQYLNTDIPLFSSENRNTDFDISFGIADRFYVSGQTNNMNVLMSDMDESGNPYPGFVFRFQNSNATNYNFSKNNNASAGTTNYAINATNNFYLQRRGNTLYSGTNPSSMSEALDYTNGPDFTTPLSFGASINGSGSPFRYFGGELTDITVTSRHDGPTVTITLPNSTFTHYTVEGWYSDAEYTQLVGTPNQTITLNQDTVLYPKWIYACPANTICYMDNGADEGLMTDQSVSSNSTARLIPSNFSRTGYGFAGWNTAEDGSGTNYGSSETINTGDLTTSGLKLYANWIQSAGTIQNWSGCAAMTRGAITALTDSRDGNTYAVAKYSDDHCWMMENLRLDLSDQDLTLTDRNTNHPDTTFATTINTTHPASSNSFCNTSSAECVNQILHNNNNSNRSLTQSYTANNTTSGWYAYGHYYNYYTATAGTGTYEMNTAGEQATGDLCPTGWRLPTGQATTGDLSVLDVALGGTGANQGSSSSASLRWRTSPINYVYSGEWSNNNVTSRNSYGSYHTSTIGSSENIYNLWIRDAGVNMSANTGKKYAGQTIRCLAYEAVNYASASVTFPEHVASVTFTNGADTQTATPSDNTVELIIGRQYAITANFDPGYELDAWTAGENATIGDTAANPTTLNVTDDTTLTLTAKPQILTCSKQYRLQNADGTYPATFVADGSETMSYGDTCSYTKSETNYETASSTVEVLGNTTISLDLPRTTYTLTISKNDTYISSTTSTGAYRWGQAVDITATPLVGSRFTAWTQTAGTTSSFADASSATTTFTMPLSDATIYADGESIPTHDLNITLDAGTASISFFSPDYPAQTITNEQAGASSQTTTISLREGVPYTITTTLANGYEFSAWTTGASATIGDASSNPTTLTIANDSTLSVTTTDQRILINYDGNGLYYNNDPSDTINQVYYYNNTTTTTETVTRYSHTPNVSDAGIANGNYADNLDITDTITIDGATSLNVTVYYDTESASWDWVSVYQSPFNISNSNDATASATTGNLSGKLAGRNSGRTTSYSTWYTQSYTVTGDTVKLHFRSDSSSNYYGYYAIITADVNVETEILTPISDTYAVPSSAQPHAFLGWSEDRNATTPTYADENDIIANSNYHHSDSPVTLYAIYQTPSEVTVTLDEHVTSITFATEGREPQVVTTSGSTVNILKNIPYEVTATFASGYELSSWSTTSTGTLTSTTTNPTTYTITGSSTLTVTSQQSTQSSCTSSPMLSTVVSGITYMQDINDSNMATVLSAISTDSTYQIKDNRDNETYCVGKLQDNNLWLLDNLALDLTSSTVLNGMNESNTNASNTTLGYLKNGGGTTSDQYAITGVINWTDSPTYASSYSYSDPLVNLTDKDVVPTDTTSTSGGYKVGGYYNYCAASAGSYCYGNGTSEGTSSGNATEDICPKGWRMPTGDTSGEYQTLYNNSSYNTYANYRSALRLPLSGYFSNGSAVSQGSIGRFWSSTRYSNNNMYYLRLLASGFGPANYIYRYGGLSIRCVADPPSTPTTESVTVNLDASVTSVSFTNATYGTQNVTTDGGTVNLYPNTSYTVTATFASGYELSSWSTTSSGTLTSTTDNPTTYTITASSTLTVTSKGECAGKICYDANGNNVAGTMGKQSATDNASVTLLASNFSRTGYGFAGWSDKADYATNSSAKFYGPQETITVPTGTSQNGLKLYAVWIESEGSIQDQSKVASVCNSLTTAPTDDTANLSSVSALTDQRDNNTYAIAKLADGNCWMIENLRLESTAEHNSDGTLAQGYGTSATYGNFGGLANTESANFDNVTTVNSLYYSGTQEGTASINIGTSNDPGYRMPRYNNANTSTRASSPTSNDVAMYSYGNYYTWHAAIADLTYNGADNNSTTGTSLCPTGWRLPQGGDKTRIESNDDNDFWNLTVDALNNGANPANYSSSTQPYYTGASEAGPVSDKFRSYPNNFLYSGYFNSSSANNRGSYGRYWSSTAVSTYGAYGLGVGSSVVVPGTNYDNKYYGQSIRCVAGSLTPTPTAQSVTVNLDSNVTSVSFTNATYGTQNVTTNGGTVTLRSNTPYEVTATFASGYELSSWSTTSSGTLTSTTANPTTYTITAPSTLTVASQQSAQPTQSSCPTSPMLSTVVPGITYMQDINDSNMATVMSAISTGSTYQIKDNRDNETYCVGKLQDNNLWLLDNLALDLTNSTVLNGMSESNTNATNTALRYLKNGGGTTSDQYAITGVINWTDSPTYASDYSYSDPLVNLTNKDAIPTDATSTAGGYKVGGYYNYCAASAGSYCYGNGTDYGTSSGNATSDICPKGWRMPTGSSSGEYSALANAIYGSTSSTSDATAVANYRSALHSPLSGYFNGGTASSQGSYGSFWSSTRYDNGIMHGLYVRTSSIDPASNNYRFRGYSVRCVLDQTPTMQEQTPSSLSALLPNVGNTTTLKDSRDDQKYTVGKLADGKYWMTENLNLAGGTALSANDTDVTSAYISSFTTSNNLTKSGDTIVLPASSTSGFTSDNYSYVYNSGNKTNCGAYGQNTPCYSYYSWDAATLGSGRTIATENTDAAQSICPKGWRLPTSRTTSATNWQTTSDFYQLAHQYGLDSTTSTSEGDNGFYTQAGPGTTPNFLLAGYYRNGSLYNDGSYGYYWSSSSYSSTSLACNLYFRSSYVYSASSLNRYSGVGVRCLFSPTPTTQSVTVNLDSNVTSVSFTNATYGTQNVTTNGGTVSLYPNTSYTVIATFASGYELSSWSTTSAGTLTSTTANPTTYTITAPSTLTVTSREYTPSSCASSPMLSTVVSGINYMQDINSSNKSTVLSAITTGSTYQIKDNRDNETYCVGKLQDNNLWLLDNLALDLTNSTVLNGMSESNTNASNTTLGYLKNGGGTTSDKYAITGVINWTDSPTYASGYSYSDPLVNLTNKGTIPTDATSTSGGYKVGGYYNYCAASAGSYCYGNGTSSGTSTGNATEDICPKGWRMPTGNTSGEYSALANAIYGSTSSTSDPTAYANYRSALHSPLSGDVYSGSAGSQGSYGYFWSSTRLYNNSMYDLNVYTGSINPAGNGYRYRGYSVRCVADPPSTPTTQSVTVNLDSGVTSVSFTNATYGTQNVTTNGGTATLRPNTPYEVTATFASGYELSSWSTTSAGTLTSTTDNPTTYEVTAPSTLTVTSQQSTPSPATTFQSFTPSTCAAMRIGDTVSLTDTRDNEVYTIGKRTDNTCWMLDNLRLGSSSPITLTPADTNISSNFTLPASTVTGASYTGPKIYASTKNNTATNYGAGSGKIGVYYNYCAASAGTYCYNENAGVDVPNTDRDITGDICPKGWEIPTSVNPGSDDHAFVVSISAALSGKHFFDTGETWLVNNYGEVWESTYLDGSEMSFFTVSNTNPSGGIDASILENRTMGRSIRCTIDGNNASFTPNLTQQNSPLTTRSSDITSTTSTTNTTNVTSSNNSTTPITDSTDQPSSNTQTTDPTDTITDPHGVTNTTGSTVSPAADSSNLAPVLIIGAATSALAGTAFFVYAASKKDDDDE